MARLTQYKKLTNSLILGVLVTLILASTVSGHGHHHHHHHDHDHDHDHVNPHHEHGSSSGGGVVLTTLLTYLFPTESAMVNSFLATFYISLFPNLILLVVPSTIENSKLNLLVSFAVGGLLGDVFLHLLPHTFHDTFLAAKGKGDDYLLKRNLTVGISIFVGAISFFVLDKLLRIVSGKSGHSHSHSHSHAHNHSHEHENEHKSSSKGNSTSVQIDSNHSQVNNRKPTKSNSDPALSTLSKKSESVPEVKHSAYLNLIADFSHNFTDGLAIAASFYASKPIGISTTLAVFLHEIPHEVGDFAILLQAGFSRIAAMYSQFFTALGAFLGTVVGVAIQEWLSVSTDSKVPQVGFLERFGIPVDLNDLVLPLTAGGFLYIATVSVIPELLEVPDDLKDKEGKPDKLRLAFQLGLELICMGIGVALMALVSLYE